MMLPLNHSAQTAIDPLKNLRYPSFILASKHLSSHLSNSFAHHVYSPIVFSSWDERVSQHDHALAKKVASYLLKEYKNATIFNQALQTSLTKALQQIKANPYQVISVDTVLNSMIGNLLASYSKNLKDVKLVNQNESKNQKAGSEHWVIVTPIIYSHQQLVDLLHRISIFSLSQAPLHSLKLYLAIPFITVYVKNSLETITNAFFQDYKEQLSCSSNQIKEPTDIQIEYFYEQEIPSLQEGYTAIEQDKDLKETTQENDFSLLIFQYFKNQLNFDMNTFSFL